MKKSTIINVEYQILTLIKIGARKKGTMRTEVLFNVVKSNEYGELWINNNWIMGTYAAFTT